MGNKYLLGLSIYGVRVCNCKRYDMIGYTSLVNMTIITIIIMMIIILSKHESHSGVYTLIWHIVILFVSCL